MRWLIMVVLMLGQCGLAAADVHEDGNYALTVEPHPGLGKFQLRHDPDRPVIASYGGFGLRRTDEGAWVSSKISQTQDIDRLIERCDAFGLRRLCCNLYYQWIISDLVAPPPAEYRDLIPYMIEQAHAHNIEVYACMPVFSLRAQDKPFINANPDCYTLSVDGEPGPLPSPAYRNVRAYKQALILDMCARYPWNGIQLDYIRWPAWPRTYGGDMLHDFGIYGYDEPVLTMLRQRYDLAEDFRPQPDDDRFVAVKQEFVSLFISELRDAMTRSGIDLPIGVYNSSSYGGKASWRTVHQDWQHWEKHALVDQHHPMFYMDSMTRLGRALTTLVSMKRPDSMVLAPLFLDGGYVPTPVMCKDAARRGLKLGCDGIWICRPMELERYGLWNTIGTISAYSLSGIRNEGFDPLYENLLGEPDGDNWTVQPADALNVDDDMLSLRLNPGAPVYLRHNTVRLSYPVCGVRSLGFAFQYRTESLQSANGPWLTLTVDYGSGLKESKAFALTPTIGAAVDKQLEFRLCGSDRQRRQVDIDLEVEAPPGSGLVQLSLLKLTYDPLDNPLKASSARTGTKKTRK